MNIKLKRVNGLSHLNINQFSSMTYPLLSSNSEIWKKVNHQNLSLCATNKDKIIGLAIASRTFSDQYLRLISLKIDPSFRRKGIGTKIINKMSEISINELKKPLFVKYIAESNTESIFEAFLKKLNWSRPYCEFIIGKAHINELRGINWSERFPIKNPYRIKSLFEIDDIKEKEFLTKYSLQNSLSNINYLEIERNISLILLYKNTIVGWILAHKKTNDSIRYTNLFVESIHRKGAKGMVLISESINRQNRLNYIYSTAGVYSKNTQMLKIVNKRLINLCQQKREIRISFNKRIQKKEN